MCCSPRSTQGPRKSKVQSTFASMSTESRARFTEVANRAQDKRDLMLKEKNQSTQRNPKDKNTVKRAKVSSHYRGNSVVLRLLSNVGFSI